MSRKLETNPAKILKIVRKAGTGIKTEEVIAKVLTNDSLCKSLKLKEYANKKGISKSEAAKKKIMQTLASLKTKGRIESINVSENSRKVMYIEVTTEINKESKYYIPADKKEVKESEYTESLFDVLNREYPFTAQNFLDLDSERGETISAMKEQGRTPKMIADIFNHQFGNEYLEFTPDMF